MRCDYRQKCLEGCRYSIRISQDGHLHPCGVKKTNVISLLDKEVTNEQITNCLREGGKI